MKRLLTKNLTAQVLLAITLGAVVGHVRPDWGQALGPVGEGFIRMVKMVVGPIIFLTIVVGIASMGDLKKVGRVGIKALFYFEVVTTIALALGLIVANVVRPGNDVHATAKSATTQVAATTQAVATTQATATAAEAKVAGYAAEAGKHSTSEFLLNVIPDNMLGAFARGDLLQILFISVLTGVAVAGLGGTARPIVSALESATSVMFRIVALVMKVAPIGAFGAMAFTIGKFGLSSLLPLVKLMACVYLTMFLFVVVFLGIICRMAGFSLWQFLVYIREELLLVLGTSSSESALPRMIERLEACGCSRGVVGLVIPAGYSFNLDGTSIYLSMAILFIAQAYGVDLSLGQQLSIMSILMLTSKGAAAVTGGGFVTLAATLAATHVLPVEGLALLLGVDRFMSEARAITNLIGNGVATMVVSKWEGEFDQSLYDQAMAGDAPPASVSTPELDADLSHDSAAEHR